MSKTKEDTTLYTLNFALSWIWAQLDEGVHFFLTNQVFVSQSSHNC